MFKELIGMGGGKGVFYCKRKIRHPEKRKRDPAREGHHHPFKKHDG